MCLGIPGRITEITIDESGGFATGLVDFEGAQRAISLACTPDARMGDYVMVHAGMALQVIEESEALQTLDTIRSYLSCEYTEGQSDEISG